MPTDYHCEDCDLAIQIGWFHYHSAADGYWAATLGFCQKCGTIHKLEHAYDDALPVRLSAQPGPLPIGESKIKGIAYHIPLQDWKSFSEAQACSHCGAQHTVLFGSIEETPTIQQCPRCNSLRMKKLYSWMT